MAKKESTPTIQPLGDRVLIQLSGSKEGERKLDSGIILPSSVKSDQDSTKRGTVVAVGPGKRDEGEIYPIQGVSLGDTVLFSWGDQMTVDGVEYYLVGEQNILAIVK